MAASRVMGTGTPQWLARKRGNGILSMICGKHQFLP